MVIIIVLFFVFVLFLFSFTGSFNKGKRFEQRIISKLSNSFNDSMVLNNLYIPFNDNYVEIDCLLINRNGIYVIEAKNYSGWIFANYKSKYWMAIHYKRRYRFYNPIRQNLSHIDCLKKIVKESVIYHNVVVFSNRCEFKELVLSNYDNVDVIHYNSLISVINKEHILNSYLNNVQIEKIYNDLLKFTNPTQEVIDKHNDYVKRKKIENMV